MTGREKLIEFIRKADKEDYDSLTMDEHYAYMADHLIGNGVTFATDNNVASKTEIIDIHVPCRTCGKLIPAGVTYCLHCRLKMLNDTEFTALIAKTMPKSDLIRSMSDEELAWMLIKANDGELRIPFCKNLDECYDYLDRHDCAPEEKCMRCMLEWLQQPAEVE